MFLYFVANLAPIYDFNQSIMYEILAIAARCLSD